MSRKSWLLCVTFVAIVAIVAGERVSGDESISDAIRSLREQVNALLDHRQQDYNALEGSLKRAIEKNTELFVLKNEIKQLRKEVISLRDGNGNGSGSGNEAKNERLRVRWLGNAVTELQGEVAEVLRTRNASQELAERSRMKGEVSLLKGDVAAVGKGIRNLGGRIAKIEAVLGTIRVDIAAVKERFNLLSRTCADIASQLSSVQMEVKSLRCESPLCSTANSPMQREGGGEVDREREREREKERGGGGGESAAGVAVTVASSFGGTGRKDSDRKSAAATERERERGRGVARRRVARRHGYWRRSEGHGHLARLEDRLKSLERKISLTTVRRASLETRIAAYRYENQEWSSLSKRIKSLEKAQVELSGEVSNVNEKASSTKKMGESLSSRLVGSLRALEYAIETNNASVKRELMRLSVNAARKAAELSLTREELNSLRRTVQAVSVSASKLQERSDKQQEAIDRLNLTVSESAAQPVLSEAALPSLASLEQLEDRYHLIGDSNNLTEDCSWNGIENGNENGNGNGNRNGNGDGLRLVRRGQGARPMLVFCREGWTVIARRIDGTLDFDRSWSDYAFGFGSPVSEYWIGNEILHRLTRDNCSSLRIDMSDIYGERWRAEYQWFAVESEEAGYRLSVRGYTGNATDALSYQNGMRFSAKDRDMDASAIHCARNYHGGWWFSRCQHANLNGKYSLGLTWFRSDANRWLSIASSEMSLRLNSNCRSR